VSECRYKGKCEWPDKTGCPYFQRCQLYEDYRLLARAYLALQRERMAQAARVRKLVERKASEDIIRTMMAHQSRFRADEKAFLEDATTLLKDNPIFEFAETVKGMGIVGGFMLLHINPYKANTVGRVKAFAGYAPGLGLKAGRRARFDPSLKGRIWLVTRNIIMARDPYYVPIYQAKKWYYLNTRGMARYIQDPTLCPEYQNCWTRIVKKAQRLKRKPKKLPCKGHADAMAKHFLAGILLGNALEILREYEGLPVDNIRAHRNYVRPKPFPDATPPKDLLERLKSGEKAK